MTLDSLQTLYGVPYSVPICMQGYIQFTFWSQFPYLFAAGGKEQGWFIVGLTLPERFIPP